MCSDFSVLCTYILVPDSKSRNIPEVVLVSWDSGNLEGRGGLGEGWAVPRC